MRINPSPYDGPPIQVDENDVKRWMDAAEKRRANKPPTDAEITAFVKAINRYRFWRLRKDYRWLQRRIKQVGGDPYRASEFL